MNDAAILPCGRHSPKTQTLAQWQERLKRYLVDHQLKSSEQRWMIANWILESQEHFSAQDLVRKVQEQDPNIGAATVYRNIKVLCDAGVLQETLSDASGRVVFEPASDLHHDHLVCLDCEAIFEFHSDEIETAQTKIAAELEFEPTRHRHVLFARCKRLVRSPE